jgi:hypothetical protein
MGKPAREAFLRMQLVARGVNCQGEEAVLRLLKKGSMQFTGQLGAKGSLLMIASEANQI